MDTKTTAQEQLKQREKFVLAFNDTMVKIWKEKITLLDVIDTGTLLNSVVGVKCNADGQFMHIELGQSFRTYGLWQDRGVGKEVYRGNPGDIGRDKVRQKKQWFSIKYYSSVMALKEFMTENMAKQFLGVASDIFDTDKLAREAWP
ncbi:MAG: hypothetical protein Q4A15_06050 [Prevotellaceae bacterium]|nr:hypothetical protein [Prevotellaceae bacterium]